MKLYSGVKLRTSFYLVSSGLKKWTGIPLMDILHMAPVTSRMLRSIPKHPSRMLRYHIKLNSWGFLICIHIRQGYAKVRDRARPPNRPAKLGKNGSADAMKTVKHPKKARIPDLNQRGHGFFLLLVNRNSRLSNTGIAYIWNEHRQCITTSKLVRHSTNLDVSFPWYSYKTRSSPSFVGIICRNTTQIRRNEKVTYSRWR